MQHVPDNALPTPDRASAQHSERVAAFIRDRIAEAGGDISFAEFMHHALYAPGLGYYCAGATKFGEAGDFITAPEVSPVFGNVLARQCAEVMAGIDRANILEIGAGSGRLAVDILRKLAELDALPERYTILEVSPDLRERQASLLNNELPGVVDRVAWLDTLPKAFTGIILANEVLDALPVERFIKRSGSVSQLCVRTRDDGFVMAERTAPAALAAAVAHIEDDLGVPLAEGYVSDVCLAASAWVADVAASIKCGMMFLFDGPRAADDGFWMWGTSIPLDIAFVDEGGVVRRVLGMEPCANADPTSSSSTSCCPASTGSRCCAGSGRSRTPT